MKPVDTERKMFAPLKESAEQRQRALDDAIRKRNPQRFKNRLNPPGKK